MSLHIVPCTIEQANDFVERVHRHHSAVVSARIALACADDTGNIRGVALAGRPVARLLDDGWTLEVNRVATDGCKNACSLLYGAVWRAARAIGYRRLITYTLPAEGGASLRAVGWNLAHVTKGHQWNNQSRPREENDIYLSDKLRWEVSVQTALPFNAVIFPKPDQPDTPELWSA
jgi:hypothetical protein